MDKFAYEVGASVGLLKFGSVEKLEQKNANLLKIAKLLQKKGKLTKYYDPTNPEYKKLMLSNAASKGAGTGNAASKGAVTGTGPAGEEDNVIGTLKSPWDYSGGEGWDPTNPEFKKQMLADVAGRSAVTGAGQSGGSPRAEVAAMLKAYAETGDMEHINKEIAAGRKPILDSRGKKGKKGKKGGAGAGVKPAAKGNWGNWFRSLWDNVGGAGAASGPIFLDNEDPKHLRNMQLYGVDAANRMKSGGGQQRQYGGGPSKAEQGFWGGPKFGDMQRYWLQMLGKTPSQLSSEDVARDAGYGRALQHKKNLDWIKSMLMGPQMGHYGMGG